MTTALPRTSTIEVPGFPGTDLYILTPGQVVGLLEFTDPRELQPHEMVPAAPLFHKGLEQVLPKLPSRDIKFGRAVVKALARSPIPYYRCYGAMLVPTLTFHDPCAGIQVWDALARDCDGTVREEAYTHLRPAMHSLVSGEMDEVLASLELLGLTWRNALNLTAAYVAAHHGENLHEINRPPNYAKDIYEQRLYDRGRLALRKLFTHALTGEVSLTQSGSDKPGSN